MVGYRRTLNISYNPSVDINGTESCDPGDDVETAAILVRGGGPVFNVSSSLAVSFLQGLIVSLLSIASLAGALVAGVLSDVAGRKPAVIIGGCLVSFGGILHIATLNLW